MSDYPQNSIWFEKCHQALLSVEADYTESLIASLKSEGVSGDFVEFGIFQGAWINLFHDMTERAAFPRGIWGFDSFAGLSKPHDRFDTHFWKEGMYACSRADVEARVHAAARPRIRLVEGFFSESLKGEEARELREVCFARIDCDIYQPALDCLHFLTERLSDGAILVFDDWSFNPEVGETRAFFEWAAETPRLKCEYLMSGPWGHIYFRVRRSG